MKVFSWLKPWNKAYSWFSSNKSTSENTASYNRDVGEHLVLFIHGLSGSALDTWEPMLKAFESDTKLNSYAFGCYAYPTKLHRLPLAKRMAGIHEIANGLRTHIETHYADKVNLILVGHSLGGVIARQYILDEIKCHRTSKIRGVVLYATPHTGASLANIGSMFSSSHRHLKQLCKGSDILEIINRDWVTLKVEDYISALYIVGGCDAVIERDSAAPYLGADNVRTLIEHDHTGVIKPTNSDDTRFLILREYILRTIPYVDHKNSKELICVKNENKDVLFDIYTPAIEPFYVERDIDNALNEATQSAHAWVSGSPGIGKTASLKRLAGRSHWRMHHIMLDSYLGLNALSLMREVCIILCERAGIDSTGLLVDADQSTLLKYYRRVFVALSKSESVAILIEEIPLPPGDEFKLFLDIANHLTLATETADTPSRVVWLFSSIYNPRLDIRQGSAKFCERVQFFQFIPWDDEQLGKLIQLICKELDIVLAENDKVLILKKANGSPRFIKMLFRRMRNEIAAKMPASELIRSVETDLS